jgi:type II secretory pathway pseudopilin PulG
MKIARAFSLIESILVVAFIGVLIAMSFPTIARVRDRARRLVSLTNLRTHGQSAAVYANDWNDAFIHITRPNADRTIIDGCDRRTAIRYFANTALWYRPIAESYYGSCQSPALYNPSRYDAAIERAADPWDYFLTASAIADPRYWNLETRAGRLQWGSQTLSNVAFPSSKVLFSDGAYGPTIEMSGAIQLGLIDGSAGRFALTELADPVASGDGAFHDQFLFVDGRFGIHTKGGVAGRDVLQSGD